jgi:hypothetical protein
MVGAGRRMPRCSSAWCSSICRPARTLCGQCSPGRAALLGDRDSSWPIAEIRLVATYLAIARPTREHLMAEWALLGRPTRDGRTCSP